MKVIAPWTTEEVKALNQYQKLNPTHAFICSEQHDKESVLVATEDGWICPIVGCYYARDWAEDFMLTGKQEQTVG